MAEGTVGAAQKERRSRTAHKEAQQAPVLIASYFFVKMLFSAFPPIVPAARS